MQEIASITDTWKNVFSLCSASDFLSTKSLNDIRKSTVLKDSNFTKQSIERYIQIQKLFKRVEITDPFKTNIYSMTKKGYKELSLTISKNYSGKINTHDLKTRMVYFSALRESCFMLDESLTKRDFHLVFPKRMMPIKTSDIALKRKLEKEREEKYKIFETLVPDAVHEENGVNVCLEFDNLTERNPQLLNKIGRYIAYAGKHLDKEFRVVFVFADDSYTKRSPQSKVKIASRHINNLLNYIYSKKYTASNYTYLTDTPRYTFGEIMDELDNIDFFFCTEKDADNVLGIQLGMANVEELNFDLDNPHSLQALYHNRDNGIDKPEFNHRYKDNYIFGYDDYTFYGEKTENEPQEVVSELAVEDDIEYENDFVTPIERLERLLGTPNPIDTSWLDDFE